MTEKSESLSNPCATQDIDVAWPVAQPLVDLTEVGAMLGVSRERARQIIGNYSDFPPPAAVVGTRRGWDRGQVEQWLSEHPVRRPGRPKKRRGNGD